MNKKMFEEFANPSSSYRAKPFWAWNGKLEPEELRRQIRIMNEMGLGGFFMHSRVGLDTSYLSKEWFECVDACIDEAKKLDMEAWLYDEDRWPSGAAGGLVTKNPKYRMRSLVLREFSKTADFAWEEETIAAFTAKVNGAEISNLKELSKNKKFKLASGEKILAFEIHLQANSDWYNGETYLDTMNEEAVAEFIKVTHEAYKKKCAQHFGNVVPGIFTDEPNYGRFSPASTFKNTPSVMMAPWTGKLAQVFHEMYDYDLLAELPYLFYDKPGETGNQVRWHYFNCITQMFVDAFSKQIGKWCDEVGLAHTGHLLYEETLSSQTTAVGSTMRFYEYMQAPGMDSLTEYRREYETPKQVSSAARQFGQKWRLTEIYGCTGWQFPFSGHKATGDWQAALGINLRCQHLSWYTMEGEAKRDYPAGIFYQSPWWRHYRKVEDYFSRIHAAMTQGEEIRDLAVIHPVESSWLLFRKDFTSDSNVKNFDGKLIKLRDTLLAANLDFDYLDEDILSRHGKVLTIKKEAILRVGKADYKMVIMPPMLTLRSTTLELLSNFRAKGGTVVFAGDTPGMVDAKPSNAARNFAKECLRTPGHGAKLAAAAGASRRISITDESGSEISDTLHLLREDENAFYLFVVNTSEKIYQPRNKNPEFQKGVRLRKNSFDKVFIRGFSDCAGKPVELDPDSGKLLSTDSKLKNKQWEIKSSLPVIGSRLFMIPKKAMKLKTEKRPSGKTVRSYGLGDKDWNYRLTENNCLVLDRPRFKIAKGKWRGPEEILRIDREIHKRLGITPRGGQMKQPWTRDKSKKSKTVSIELEYTFSIREIPSGELYLALEQAKRFQVSLNGNQVNIDSESGWWVDRSLRKIPLDPSSLISGANKLSLTCDYDEHFSGLEIVYLLGNFGAKITGTEVGIRALPEKLKIGTWVKQGLPFYSGSVLYQKNLKPKFKKGEKLFIRIPEYEGTAVRVLANGKEAGIIAWEPNEVEIPDLKPGEKLDLSIEVIGNRRNSHGPHHLSHPYPGWTGPGQYITEGDDWQDEYMLLPLGLMAAPEILIKK